MAVSGDRERHVDGDCFVATRAGEPLFPDKPTDRGQELEVTERRRVQAYFRSLDEAREHRGDGGADDVVG